MIRRNLKLNKFTFGTPRPPDLLSKHWFASSVWNFCRWVADVPPRETSPAAKSEEKRLLSQANRTPFINTAVFLFILFNFGFVLFRFLLLLLRHNIFVIFHAHTGYFYFIEILSEFIILDCDACLLTWTIYLSIYRFWVINLFFNSADQKPFSPYLICIDYKGGTLFFFYKNIFYKNIEAEICEILRIL